METLRASTKYILWLLIISFGLLWVLADTQVFDAIMAGPRSLGKVNEQPISFEAYNQKVNTYMERYRFQTGESATPELRAQYEQLAWDELVLEILIKEEMDKIGIKVTDQELVDMVMGPNPDAFIAQQFTREDGTIDRNALRAAVEAPENTQIWINVEQQLRDKRRREKLNQYLQSAVFVSDAEIEREFIKENSVADAAVVRYAYANIKDSVLSFSESDLKSYYSKNKSNYEQKKSWQISFVTFDKTPTAEDTLKTYSELGEVKRELEESDQDSLIFVQYQSDAAYTQKTIAKTDLKTEYESLLTLKDGDVTDVIKDEQKRLHVLKKIGASKDEITFIDFTKTVVADPLGTIDERAKEADDFSFFATEEGFEAESGRRNYDLKSATVTDGNVFIPRLGQSRQILNWLNKAEENQISEPFELANDFAVIKVDKVIPEGYRAFDEVKPQVERSFKNDLRKELALQKVQSSMVEGDLKATAEKLNVAIDTLKNIRFNAEFAPGLGREPYVIGRLFSVEDGESIGLVEGNNAIFYGVLVKKLMATADEISQEQRQQIKQKINQEKSTAFNQNWVEELKNNADIEDYRSLVLR